jgi:hypothetical protein
MPEQILLQGKILGTEEFLLAGGVVPSEGRFTPSAGEDSLAGRSQWITLLSEVLTRALLSELSLPRVMLGSSGGGQFLLVLPGDKLPSTEAGALSGLRSTGALLRPPRGCEDVRSTNQRKEIEWTSARSRRCDQHQRR